MDDRERQYREYLALRQQNQDDRQDSAGSRSDEKYGQYFPEDKNRSGHGDINRSRPDHNSVTGTPYGASELRRKQKEKEQRDAQMREYLAAREGASGQKSENSGRRHKARNVRSYAENKSYVSAEKGKKKKKKKKGKKIAAVIIAFIIAVAAVAAIGLMTVMGVLGSMEHIDIDRNAIAINPSVESQLDGYRNIAVLGVDARADEDDSQCRSDAIIIASINEKTDEVKMFSVYRDTLLDVGDQGLDKVTHAYFYGGAQQTLYTLNKNLDLNIDEVVVINWKTVADIIDSIGGIEIDVQESEIEEMNKYIPNTAKNVDGSDELIESAGKQTLNGVQAVTYSRIRKDAVTGDYRRNERMKIVFSETFKKLKEAGLLTMFRVAKNAAPEVKTNIDSMEVLKMGLHFSSYEMTDSTTGFPYEVASWTGYAGAGYAWYGPPVNLYNNVSKLHEQFFKQKGYAPTDTVQQISNDISYLTGIY